MHSPFVFDLITSVIKKKRFITISSGLRRWGTFGRKAEIVSFAFPVGRILFLPECVVCWGAVSVGFHVSGGCFETDGVAERGMCIFGGRVHGTGETGRFERS